MQLVFLILGIVGVWSGAWLVVEGSQKIARAAKISETFIGLTVISIGTSLPEIGTHIIASMNILKGIETSGVAVGTNIGSNIVQITLILGLVALFTKVYSDKKILKRDYLVMLCSILLLFLISFETRITKLEGLMLVVLYVAYLFVLARQEEIIEKSRHREKINYFQNIVYIIAGIGLLIYCADVVVKNAVMLSQEWNVTGAFIGTLIIGFGTALPEFTTALVAVLRGSAGLSLGTLIGSNITNPLFALGIGAMISGYVVDKELIFFDIPFWFIVSLIGLLFFWRKLKLTKGEAISLIAMYLIYVGIKLRVLI